MGAHSIVIAPAQPDDPALMACVTRYFSELAERFEGGFDAERYMSRSPGAAFFPPQGATLIAWRDGQPVGCASLKTQSPGVGEIKRVWVSPQARGVGLARRLMLALEESAKRLGHERLRLGTHRALVEAQALYPRLGYRPVAPFDDDPFTHFWFEKAAPFDKA